LGWSEWLASGLARNQGRCDFASGKMPQIFSLAAGTLKNNLHHKNTTLLAAFFASNHYAE
jgi:hypothetical protein